MNIHDFQNKNHKGMSKQVQSDGSNSIKKILEY